MGDGGVTGCGGVEGRGENADNCNRIKINKKNKNKNRKKIHTFVSCIVRGKQQYGFVIG